MSAKGVPSWQHVLDSLTLKANEWNLFRNVDTKQEVQIAAACLKNEELLSYLKEWMELCLSSSLKKSGTDSVAYRTRGNEEFMRHHNLQSLSLYTESIKYALHGSEEHALGVANRSAVLFHLKYFRECVKDVERALSLPYPQKLRLKLILRKARCYLKLGDWTSCQSTIESAERILTENIFNDKGSANSSKDEIRSIQIELNDLQLRLIDSVSSGLVDEMMPQLLNGSNPDFPFASAALELRFSDSKGRYVVTNEDVKQGDVLFVEKPYAFVVLPNQCKLHCHHCTQVLIAPVPCRSCAEVLFCDEECEKAAHASYHHWECCGISLMSAVGVAHLGLRVILTTAAPPQLLERVSEASQHIPSDVSNMLNFKDPYSAVYLLLPHIEDMELDDVFQYAATAVLLTLFLSHKSDFFKNEEQPSLKENKVVNEVCGLLLRHIAQLVCNAHAITKLDVDKSCFDSSYSSVVSESQQRIATAIFPSASMMNHSCDPNIINSFSNEVLIVKASRNIPKGQEVFNCYGPHFQRMGTAERQAALQAQYFFFCNCLACTANPGESFDPIQERLWALRCSSCGGPLCQDAPGREPASSKVVQSDVTNCHFMVCDNCGLHQPISGLVCDAFSAVSLFKKGCEKMEEGHMQDALNILNQCRELQERALYRSNKQLTATYDALAKVCATLGEYSKSVEFLELTLPAIEEQFGASSVEVAHELQKLSDVMLCNIRTMETVPTKDILENATKVVERALSILSIHYGKWNQGWQDLEKKVQELKLMGDMAMVQGNLTSKMRM